MPFVHRAKTDTGVHPLRAQAHPGCFACGETNSRGLRLKFQFQDGGRAEAAWTPSDELEGFRGIVHGGVVSTALDEAMSKAVARSSCEALTAELRVRFRRPVCSQMPFVVRGWIQHRKKRHIETEASLTDSAGEEYAHAWATFLAIPENGAPG